MPRKPQKPQPVRLPTYPQAQKTRVTATTSSPMLLRPDASVGAEIMGALFGDSRPKPTRMGPFPWTKQGGRHMEATLGSVLQVVPAPPGWSVLFAHEEDQKNIWEETVVAWAIVVIWTSDELPEGEPKPDRPQYQTEMQPVTISPEGVTEVPYMRAGIVQLAVLQPGQTRISQVAE